jgi:dTDP-4-dehydrorhamnose 3,5-epimerase
LDFCKVKLQIPFQTNIKYTATYPMDIIETPLPGLLLIQPKVFADERGHFFESYRRDVMEKHSIVADFVQDNQSLSNKGIIRGMHFQIPPFAQDKLVRVIAGAVLDVVVDIRRSSPTYGKVFSVELSAENFTMLLIPKGFAHGFETLEDKTIFSYKCTDYYHPSAEGGIAWNSPSLQIPWRTSVPTLSQKDKNHLEFSQFESPFN